MNRLTFSEFLPAGCGRLVQMGTNKYPEWLQVVLVLDRETFDSQMKKMGKELAWSIDDLSEAFWYHDEINADHYLYLYLEEKPEEMNISAYLAHLDAFGLNVSTSVEAVVREMVVGAGVDWYLDSLGGSYEQAMEQIATVARSAALCRAYDELPIHPYVVRLSLAGDDFDDYISSKTLF